MLVPTCHRSFHRLENTTTTWVWNILTIKHRLKKEGSFSFLQSKQRAWWELSFHQHITNNLSEPLACLTPHVRLSQLTSRRCRSPPPPGAVGNTHVVQNFLGCWMSTVRGVWVFSTAGRSLLCLTLTGVSGKSWLSWKEKKKKRRQVRVLWCVGGGAEASEGPQLIRSASCKVQEWLYIKGGNVCVYLVESSCQEYAHLLHPVGRGNGPVERVQLHFKANLINLHKMLLDVLCWHRKVWGNICYCALQELSNTVPL